MLDELDGQPVIRYFEHVYPVALGTEGDDVAEVLARQHYQLASWRESDAMLNYRRFFDVDQLIAVRVELPDVFEATHRVLLDAQPRRRHRRLPDRPPGRAGRPRGLPQPAARGHRARHADLGREDPGGLRAAAHLLGLRRHHRVRRDAGDPDRAGRPGHRAGPRPGLGRGGRPARRGAVGRRVPSARSSTSRSARRSATDPPGPRGPARAGPRAAARGHRRAARRR